MPRPILVAYDGSPPSREALELAAERAQTLGCRLVLVTVLPPPLVASSFTQMFLPGIDVPRLSKGEESYADTARRALESVATELRARKIEVEAVVRLGDPADEIIAAAGEMDAAQVFAGFKSYEKKVPYGLGSTVDKIVRYCDRTVTVVRPRKP